MICDFLNKIAFLPLYLRILATLISDIAKNVSSKDRAIPLAKYNSFSTVFVSPV